MGLVSVIATVKLGGVPVAAAAAAAVLVAAALAFFAFFACD
jgi:hypothetical protein